MLNRAVAAMQIDRAAAIKKFNHNEPPFRDRDLFVFCFGGQDGKFTAHEAFVTWDVRKICDVKGNPIGAEMFDNAQEGRISEIVYISQVPGTSALADKRAYVTRIGAQVCGVSAYEFVSAP